MTKEFDERSYLSQVRSLRILACEVLKCYAIGKHELKFVNHGENTTYRVITPNKSFLLRIHCRSNRTKKAIGEELKWLNKLSKQGKVRVQKPVRTKTGSLLVNHYCEAIGHHRICDLLEWSEGYIKDSKDSDTFFKVGKLIGLLQSSSIESKERHYWHADGLLGKKATLGSLENLYADFPRYEQRIERLRRIILKKLKTYEKRNPTKNCLIHADLHFGNMIWHKGEVSPIDFDDCGHGIRLYDLAVTLAQSSVYFKKVGVAKARVAKRSLLMGYENYFEISVEDLAVLPYLVAARELAMLGWLYDRRDNPELWGHLKKNIAKRVKKTQKYVDQARSGSYFS